MAHVNQPGPAAVNVNPQGNPGIVAQNIFGKGDNHQFYAHWYRTDDFPRTIFASQINVAPLNGHFNDDSVPTMILLAWYGNYINQGIRRPDKSEVYASAIGDLLMPAIPNALKKNQADAQAMMINAVNTLLIDEVYARMFSVDKADLDIGNLARDRLIHFVPQAAQPAEGGLAPRMINIDEAVSLLRNMATAARNNYKVGGLGMIAAMYMAIMKKGNVTTGYIEKVVEAIRSEINGTITIEVESLPMMYNLFGKFVNETNIEIITAHWTNILPVDALKLRNMVVQSAGSGLTSYYTICKAMAEFGDFPWDTIWMLYGAECANFEVAVFDVGENVWYGFRADLGSAKSTKFKNLAYVCKELLIKINGDAPLARYGGWTRKAKFQATVDKLIADYELAKATGELLPLAFADNPRIVNVLERAADSVSRL